MWWALAAAAIPYVMQAMQGQPDQPKNPGYVQPGDYSYYQSQLLNNAFNPHADIFQRASDTVNEQVNRNLAKAGISGSSAGAAMTANTQATLANKWLEDQTSRQNSALSSVSNQDITRSQLENELMNQQYQYGAAAYNRNNAYNSSQVAGVGGMMSGMMNGYGQYQTQQTMAQNAAAYRAAMKSMQDYYGPSAPTYGVPGPSPTGDLYSNFSAPTTGPGMMYASPNGY